MLASRLKRAILRKDPTFDEADHGFRGFGELMRHLEAQRVVELRPRQRQGDPEVTFPAGRPGRGRRVRPAGRGRPRLQPGGAPQLSGLKNQLRRRQPDFSEKRFGFSSFLSFCKAARAQGLVEMDWDDEVGDHRLHIAS